MGDMETPLISARVFGGLRDFLLERVPSEDLTSAFRASRLPEPAMYAPDRFIPLKALYQFFESLARHAGDHDYALSFGPAVDIREWGAFGAFALSSPTLNACLDRIAKIERYHTRGDRISVVRVRDEVRFVYRCTATSVVGHRQYAMAAVNVMINVCRAYLGRDWKPLRVEFDFRKPQRLEVINDVFGCPVLFEQETLTVVIHRDEAGATNVTPPSRMVTRSDILRDMTLPPSDMVGITREMIRLHLLENVIDIETIAEQMNLGARTLQRRLAEEGVIFRAIVSQVRAERASELLRETETPIIDIAVELGYSSTSHFSRAFQKTTGALPNQIRRQAGA